MRLLPAFRERLAHADALAPLAALGALSGLLTGGVVVAFRAWTEDLPTALGLMSHGEAFEALPPEVRLLLPIVGGLIIGLLLRAMSVGARQVGVVHVMQRLALHSGRLPWQNAVVQFICGGLSILSGHSVGREGPVIHVGAASASLMGQWMGLPNNSLRVLVACGTAAGIAASFNTPLAGVIFAMEVVMMEYTMVGFAPVIVAAVSATSLSRLVYGDAPAFALPPLLELRSLGELPLILVLGLCIGCLAAGFSASVRRVDERFKDWPLPARTTLAGAVTGLCALFAPQVMGVGYDTVQLTLAGQVALGLLAIILVAKTVATIACAGLGLPGGIIGPLLFIGAAAGAAYGELLAAVSPNAVSSAGLYALLGMGAMMGAALQAPLAALVAVIELTASPGTIMAEMLVIVAATVVTRSVFGQDSAFVSILRARGVDYRVDPVSISLSRTAVSATMSRRFARVDGPLRIDEAQALLAREPDWLLLCEDERVSSVLSRESLVAALRQAQEDAEMPPPNNEADSDSSGTNPPSSEPMVVLEPRKGRNFSTVRQHASLHDALGELRSNKSEFVLVTETNLARFVGTRGVLSEDQMLAGVRYTPVQRKGG